MCSFPSAIIRGEESEATEWEKSWKQEKITTLTRIINFCRTMPLVVSSEYYVGVLHTAKKCWYVESTRHSSTAFVRNKNRKKILSRNSSLYIFSFGIYKYFIIWPQEEDFSLLFSFSQITIKFSNGIWSSHAHVKLFVCLNLCTESFKELWKDINWKK